MRYSEMILRQNLDPKTGAACLFVNLFLSLLPPLCHSFTSLIVDPQVQFCDVFSIEQL